MVFEMERPKYNESYHMSWIAWKRCCKKVDSPRWTFCRWSRSVSRRSILSWITIRNRMDRRIVQRVGWIYSSTIHIISLQVKRKDTKDNDILLWRKAGGKWGLWHFDLILEPLSLWQIVGHHESREQIEEASPSRTNNDVGIPFSSTSWSGKSAWNWTRALQTLFHWSSFRYRWYCLQLLAIHCDRRELKRGIPHT